MMDGDSGAEMPTRHHVTTLAATSSSRPDHETLATREVLSHPRTTFHPSTYGLCEGADAVTATLISYDEWRLLSGRPRGRDNRD
jgi:hypothetical protein